MNYVNAQQIQQRNKPTTILKPVSVKQADSVKNILRPKLKIGAPNDKYEQEADRVAEQVMRMPEPQAHNIIKMQNNLQGNIAQRKCLGCEEDELIQRKTINNGSVQLNKNTTNSALINNTSESALGKVNTGFPLPSSERKFFEPRFGHDFSNVRIHTGNNADAASRDINARAYTHKNNITFANGEYTPGTVQGRRLMAHELTHTMQQSECNSGVIQRYFHQECDNDLDFVAHIRPANLLAKGMVANAIAALTASTISSSTIALLDKHFNDHSASTVSAVLEVFNDMQTAFNGDDYTYECENDCDDTNAYVYGLWSDIHLCMNKLRGKPNKGIAAIICHEFSHYYGGTDDEQYYFSFGVGSAPASLSVSDAVDNADSYEGFSYDI